MTVDSAPGKSGEQTIQSIGKYKILGTLGRGSMGVVYKGQDPEIGRIVAVKTLRKIVSTQFHNAEQALDRFKVEARSAGNLRHPNIITLFDVSVDGDIPYIVMDYVQGDSLDQVIARNERLTAGTTLHYLKQLAAALDYAHEQGVIHRDIKPSNIIADLSDSVYILDFGIARINDTISEDDKLVKSEPVMGTPGYMSPEQILNKDLDFKTDLFSLAVVAYECLAGKRPFPGKNFNEVLGNILNSKPTPITEFVAVPPEVPAAFDRLLSKNKEERPSSARELVEVLASALGMDRIEKPVLSAVTQEDRRYGAARGGNWKSFGGSRPDSAGKSSGHIDGLKKTPNVPLGDDEEAVASATSNQLTQAPPGGYSAAGGGALFSHIDDTLESKVKLGDKGDSKFQKVLILSITFFCLLAAGGLFWRMQGSQSGQQTVAVPPEAQGLSVERDVPELVVAHNNEPLLLPDTAPVPSGKMVTEMTDKEVLGVLVSRDSSEQALFQAIKEAERRRLPELVEAAAVPIMNDSYAVRLEVIKMLSRTKDARAVPLLVASLDDHDPAVRGNAARALGALGSRKALSYLRASLGKESNSSVRDEMRSAIETINGFPLK